MKVTIDGIIYHLQSQGGISHIFDEILPRMCDQDDSLSIDLLISGKHKKETPVHPHIHTYNLFPIDILCPTRIWGTTRFPIRAYLQYLTYPDKSKNIWHSTYYTLPYKWNGPVVITAYDLITERFALDIYNKPRDEKERIHQRKCIERADRLISISETTKLDLELYYQIDPQKIQVIHLAASPVFRLMKNVDHFPDTPLDKPFLLYVGNRKLYKSFRGLLKAYSLWSRKNEVDLAVVGSAWEQEEIKMMNELKLTNQVKLFVEINKEKLSLLYNLANAFVFPSTYEGFGIPLLEAMACGCPIVASRIPSTIEVAGDCPVYFEPEDIDSFLSALDTIIAEGRNSRRVDLGLEHVNQYSWDKTAHETLKVYRELL